MLQHEEDEREEQQALDADADLHLFGDLGDRGFACLRDLSDPDYLDEAHEAVELADAGDTRDAVEAAHHEDEVEWNHRDDVNGEPSCQILSGDELRVIVRWRGLPCGRR